MLGRLGLAVTGFSAGIFFISWQMNENHLAHPRNPAWQIISGLRSVILGLWTLAIVICACFFIFEAVEKAKARRDLEKRMQEEKERSARERILNAERYERQESERKRQEAEKQIELALKQTIEDEKREMARQAHIEKMKSRSPDEATNDALKDFF